MYNSIMPSKSTPPPAVDWRAEAEARGRAAFEQATAEPPTPAPPAWWESPNTKGKKESR
jgi:hypothetical protein